MTIHGTIHISNQLCMPETIRRMIIYHPDRLHISITDRAADKLEATLFQVLAHRIADRGIRRKLGEGMKMIDDWPMFHKRPDITVECPELFYDV